LKSGGPGSRACIEVKAIYVPLQTTVEEFVDTQAAVEVVRSNLIPISLAYLCYFRGDLFPSPAFIVHRRRRVLVGILIIDVIILCKIVLSFSTAP
jgi:hypothetical protein